MACWTGQRTTGWGSLCVCFVVLCCVMLLVCVLLSRLLFCAVECELVALAYCSSVHEARREG
jgi:hypothetical protein